MRLRVCRTDGKIGQYVQDHPGRAQVLAQRLNPETLFRSGPIVIGVLNPFSILQPDEVCWVEARTSATDMATRLPHHVERIRRLADRAEYEALLARQWPKWRTNAKNQPGDLLEALVELTFRGADPMYLHVTGFVENTSLAKTIFGPPCITASVEPDGIVYINPRCVVRARVYHSMTEVNLPEGLWCAEADEI